MNKRGLVGKILIIIGIAILVLLLITAGVFVYLYNYHVFETVRVCVGEGEDMNYSCESTQDCFDAVNMSSIDLSDAPGFLQEKFQEVLDEAVYCDGTCFVKNIRGINQETHEIEMVEFCEPWETEVAVDIRGKEGLAIMDYLKSLEK